MIDALTVTPQFVFAHILYDIIKKSQQFLLILWQRPMKLECIGRAKRRKFCGYFQPFHQCPDFPVFLCLAFLSPVPMPDFLIQL